MSRLTAFVMAFGVIALGACGDTITPPADPRIAVLAGDHQSANVRHTLLTPLTVSVTTPNGAAVSARKVEWTVTNGGGTLSASSGMTDSQGHASVTWTLGNSPGAQAVAVSIANVDASPASFTAIATAPIVLHYDGTGWSTALEDVNGASVSLTSIWGATGSAVFASGRSCGGPLVLQYDGARWGQPPPSCTGNPSFLANTSVWGSSASDVFITERNSLPIRLGGDVRHYDGQNWSLAYVPPCSPTGINCPSPQAVWSSSPGDAFVVGDAGVIAHFDGTSWTELASGTTQRLAAVWGDGPGGAVFAVGAAGSILYYDRSTWRIQTSGTTQALYAVWGTSASDVFAVGAAGTVLHYDGATWTAQSSGSTQALRSVWGISGKVFAVGDASTIVEYNGTNWAAQSTAADMDLRGIWGTSLANVFAVGAPR